MSQPLNVSELDNKLSGLTEWKRFGIHLRGMQSHHIIAIEQEKRNSMVDSKLALYDTWLKVCPDATWLDVAMALKEVEENTIASTIANTHCQIRPHPILAKRITINFPENEEKIIDELTELNRSFISLLQDLRKHIETAVNQQPSNEDRLYEITANIEDADLDGLTNVTECKSTAELTTKIRKACNFLDGTILHGIVEFGLHDKALIARTMEHVKKAKAFKQQTPLSKLKDELSVENYQASSQITVIQLNECWGKATLKLVEKLVIYIANIDKAKAKFIQVFSGSINITFSTQRDIEIIFNQLTQQSIQFMQLTGVFGLMVGEVTVFQEEENQNYTFEQGLLEASKTGHLQAVSFILHLQADINYQNDEGTTALMLASQHGHSEIVKALLSAEANVNIQDNIGHTAVMLAKTIEIYQILVLANADTNIVTHKGRTPLYVSCFEGHHEVANYILFTLKQDITTCSDGATLLMVASLRGNYEIVEHFLESGHDPNSQDIGRTAIELACINGHYMVVELLLKYDADPTIPDHDGWTPLMAASEGGHLKIVQLFIQKGIDPNVANSKNGETALIIASKNGHHDTAELLLTNGANPNIQSISGSTAIEAACWFGYYTITELLLKHNANPNIPDDNGLTPLLAASFGGHHKIVELLLSKFNDLTAINIKDGMTALMIASYNGHLETVKLLLQKGNDPNIKLRGSSETAIILASVNNHYTVTELLLNNGADPNIPKSDKCTPLMLASQKGHYRIAELLLQNGVDPNFTNITTGTTPLIYATENSHYNIVELLLAFGADPNIQNNDGRTALELASMYGHYEIVQLLVSLNITKFNLQTDEGWTPLMAASQEGHYKIVELLLQKGADPNIRNKRNGKTALIQASKNGHHQTVQLLLKAGSDSSVQDTDGLTAEEQAFMSDHEAVLQLLQSSLNESSPPTADGQEVPPPMN